MLTVTVPATMTADEGIQEAQPKAQPHPSWLEQCLVKGHNKGSWLKLEQAPSLDLANMRIVSNYLKFRVKGADGVLFSDTKNIVLWKYQRLGRIVGRIDVHDPNVPTLEAMHDLSYELNRAVKEYAKDKPFSELTWSRPARSKAWSSSTAVILITILPPNRLSWNLVVDIPDESRKVTDKLLSEAKNHPSLNSVSIDYNLTDLQRLGHKLFSPDYRGVLTFRPEYVELLYEEDDGRYSNICFHVT